MESIDFSKLDKVFIIAELSANHNGRLETAIETIRAAKEPVQMLLNYRHTLQIL